MFHDKKSKRMCPKNITKISRLYFVNFVNDTIFCSKGLQKIDFFFFSLNYQDPVPQALLRRRRPVFGGEDEEREIGIIIYIMQVSLFISIDRSWKSEDG